MLKSTMIAGLGGFFGTILRFLSTKLGVLLCSSTFPLGTFVANMVGCFLIGLFYGILSKRTFMTRELNVFLITGLCGSFTTFSTFSYEMDDMLQVGDYGTFVGYLVSSLVFGLLMVVVGNACVRKHKEVTVQ